MSINQRINELITIKKFRSVRSFAREIDVVEGTLHNIVSGKKVSPSLEVIQKILTTFPDVSARWLILNEGNAEETTKGDAQTFDKMLKSIDYFTVKGGFEELNKNLATVNKLDKDIEVLKKEVGKITTLLKK